MNKLIAHNPQLFFFLQLQNLKGQMENMIHLCPQCELKIAVHRADVEVPSN